MTPWFKLWTSHLPVFEAVSDEMLGKAIRAALLYCQTEEVPQLDPMTNLLFVLLRRDIEDAKSKCQVAAENGKRAMEKRWKNADNRGTDRITDDKVAIDCYADDSKPNHVEAKSPDLIPCYDGDIEEKKEEVRRKEEKKEEERRTEGKGDQKGPGAQGCAGLAEHDGRISLFPGCPGGDFGVAALQVRTPGALPHPGSALSAPAAGCQLSAIRGRCGGAAHRPMYGQRLEGFNLRPPQHHFPGKTLRPTPTRRTGTPGHCTHDGAGGVMANDHRLISMRS